MGANLLPLVRNFSITTRTFAANDCAVQEKCVIAGQRTLMRFDFLSWNAGNADLVMGAPSNNQQLYEWSACHGHWHLRDFNTFKLYDCNGVVRSGLKQAFCLIDIAKVDPAAGPKKFNNCNTNQGVTAGWADVYGASLDCQWVDITGVPNGDYTLESWTNRNAVVKEDRYGDNLTWTGLRIQGSAVTEIPVPCYPEDCIPFNPANVQAKKVGATWKVVDGSHWMMDFGAKAAAAKTAVTIIKHYKMDRMCFVGRPSKDGKQLMQYFKTGGGAGVPTGVFPGEDAIPCNPASVQAVQAGGRWKVTQGTSWMLDFGSSRANAEKAVGLIKKYAFTRQCFVGRPNPPMTYFRK